MHHFPVLGLSEEQKWNLRKNLCWGLAPPLSSSLYDSELQALLNEMIQSYPILSLPSQELPLTLEIFIFIKKCIVAFY